MVWERPVFQLKKYYLNMARGGERKTLACLGNYRSFRGAGLWRARKWVERNEAQGIKLLPCKPHWGVCLTANEPF